jgi:hypothetical protein
VLSPALDDTEDGRPSPGGRVDELLQKSVLGCITEGCAGETISALFRLAPGRPISAGGSGNVVRRARV